MLLMGICLLLPSCAADLKYQQIPIPDRRMNLRGLEAVSTEYLNQHPQDFHVFGKILTEADDALGAPRALTRGHVMAWIRRQAGQAGYDENMPVYLFLRAVYLRDWEGAYWTFVDEGEREYLYDLISAVMGGMHLCTTCSTTEMAQ